MKKLYLILFTIFSVLFAISCANEQKKITGSFEVIPDEPVIETNKKPDGTEEVKVYYNLYTPYVTVDGESKDIWKVESNDYTKLDKIWESIVKNLDGGQTIAYAPGYSRPGYNETRKSYFGYEIGKTGNEEFNFYKKDKSGLNKTYKGTRIVRIPITGYRNPGAYEGKFTVAGVYTVNNTIYYYDSEVTQYANDDEAIVFRADLPFGGAKLKSNAKYYAMQFLYTTKVVHFQNKNPKISTQREANGVPYTDYETQKYVVGWSFARASEFPIEN